MKDEMLFGTAYYPEYMPYDRMDTDMQMMKHAGINVIRVAESTWSMLEPQDGLFDFSWIDRILEKAEEYGLAVVVGTPTYAVPSWLVKKDEAVMVTTKDGRAKYGHRQLVDLCNSTFRYHAERVIRELIKHTVGHPTVIGFQIDNETKHYGTASEEVQAMFVEYLKGKFGTTDELNKVFGLAFWSNSIADWEDFPDMKGCINAGLSSEFAAFQRRLAADYLAWQAGIVNEYRKENQFLTHNLDFEWKKFGADIAQDGYSYGVQPDICHYDASKCLTIVGTDIYHPTQDELTGAEIAFGGDSIRSLKQKNYLVMECQAQAFKYWTPYPGQLRLHAYSHLASGADGLMYWNWHSIHNGYETYWKGILSHDFERNPAYDEICRIGKEWKQLAPELLHLRKENQIALIVDNHSLNAFKWFPIDKDLSYNDVVRWMYDSLYEMNLECDIVDVNALDTDKYKMIIVPALYSVKEEILKKLERFVERGGILVSSFKSFVADEHLSVYHDIQPHHLHKCFGMNYNQFTEPGKTTLNGRKVSYFMELLKVEKAEVLFSYEHKYWGSFAAVTRNSYGKGSAYYIGCYTEKETLKDIYLKAAQDAGIRREFKEVVWPLTIRSGVNQYGKRLHYVLNYSEAQQQVENPYECARDLLTDMSYKKGEKIHLSDWGVTILEEQE